MWDSIQKFFGWANTLPFLPKLLLSIVVVLVALLILAILWASPRPARNVSSMWPEEKSLDGLKRRLDRISEKNAAILKLVAEKDRYGVYVGEIATKLNITRDEAVLRSKELQTNGLVEVLPLTDLNVRLNQEMVNVVGNGAGPFIVAYL